MGVPGLLPHLETAEASGARLRVLSAGYSSTTSAEAADFLTLSAAVRPFDFDEKLSPDVAVVWPFDATRRHRYLPPVARRRRRLGADDRHVGGLQQGRVRDRLHPRERVLWGTDAGGVPVSRTTGEFAL